MKKLPNPIAGQCYETGEGRQTYRRRTTIIVIAGLLLWFAFMAAFMWVTAPREL